MKFRSIASPEASIGTKYDGKKIVVPNDALSLEEILARFTRGEAIPVGKEINYHESDDDLEKVATMDLVDKEEYMDKLKETQKAYTAQEKRKEKAERDRLEKIAVEKLAAEKAAAEKAQNQPPAK